MFDSFKWAGAGLKGAGSGGYCFRAVANYLHI